MALQEWIEPFPWVRYSRKLQAKIDRPSCIGFFDFKESEERGVRLAQGLIGSIDDGNMVKIYWLVDKSDGSIIDAKFQVYGQSALIGAAQAACELVIGKNYDQASRLTTELIDRQVRDKPDTPAFPRETFPHLNLVLEAIESAVEQCTDIPLPTSYVAPPVPEGMGDVIEGGYPGWMELPLKQKLAVIEQVLNEHVRPYIALDAGGVEVLNLLGDKEVVITYQGACTSCYSSVGTTLSYIQQILRNRVHPDITVTPNVDFESPYG